MVNTKSQLCRATKYIRCTNIRKSFACQRCVRNLYSYIFAEIGIKLYVQNQYSIAKKGKRPMVYSPTLSNSRITS